MTVSPGVQVVADADEPLFFADGYYWLYRDNVWLRSDSYRGGFARIDVNVVPGEIRDIQQPQVYAHYRRHAGQNYARGSQIRERQPARPQGTYQPPMQQQQQQPQPPMQRQPQPAQPAQPGRTPTEPQPSSPSQHPPVPNPMPQNQGSPGSQIPQNAPAPLPSQRDRDTGSTTPSTDRDRSGSGSGMNRDTNDASKDSNQKARGSDDNKNKKDRSDKDLLKPDEQ